jgi:hypothetical protein
MAPSTTTNFALAKGASRNVATADHDSNMDKIDKAIGGKNIVAFSATPVFDASLASLHQISLTAAVTSSSVTNAKTGQRITLKIIQDSASARTFAFPANFKGATAISATLSQTSVQSFIFDGTNWMAEAAGVNFA